MSVDSPEIVFEIIERVLAVLDICHNDISARDRVRELQCTLWRNLFVAQTLRKYQQQ